VYLEAGSGAQEPISPAMITAVKKHVSVPVITGGGIRDPKAALAAKNAGADAIVTGNMVEEESLVRKKINEIVSAIRD
ncbi:glycerol-3-phosphate responsive antiterminator, partial [Candidatus Bathyarchaeota archaeon]|nr:glycerol-3-phosphate responsive antiterminator [Candidatus Bathyarchaeota archaeon]